MSLLTYLLILIELLIISYFDLKTKKIANLWSLFNIAFFIFCVSLLPEYNFQLNTFVFPLTFLMVGFVMFALHIMGAGDVKFLFSFFLIVPLKFHEPTFIYLSYLTIIIGLFLLTYNTIKNIDRIKLAFLMGDIGLTKGIFGKKFSYAPVILLAWVCLGWELRKKFY